MTGFSRFKAKQFFLVLTVFAVVFAGLAPADAATKKKKASGDNPRYASIVIDADTGAILSQSNPDKRLHPASLTKVMTLLMAFEAMQNGTLSSSDRMRVSKYAAGMAPSKLDLPAGSSIKVQDAIYAMVTKSANDVAVVMAEHIGGTESNFGRMMTRRARELGMNNTTFVNASGLHDTRQISTARDMALLARYVINTYPSYYRYFSTKNFSYQGRSYHNHNRLMETYKGMDGMKTGYVGASGFNLVASAKRGDRRLIGVVFGGRTTASRNAHMAELLDRGFGKKDSDVLIASADAPAPSEKPILTFADNLPTKPAPVPPAKPALLAAVNSLNKMAPVPGQTSAQPPVRLASMAPIVDSSFDEIVGEGDIDPAEARRIQTGLVAVSAIKGNEVKAAPARMLTAPSADNSWAIQIGAYSSRATTDQAIHAAARKLPASLSGASPVIAPLQVKDGWVFRGRLSGYSREDAFRACKHLKECMPVAPQN